MFSEVSEVSVTYKIEDVSVELIVLLPEDYPLHPPTVREGKRVRVEASQWRKWMLQLHIFLTKQVRTICSEVGMHTVNFPKSAEI